MNRVTWVVPPITMLVAALPLAVATASCSSNSASRQASAESTSTSSTTTTSPSAALPVASPKADRAPRIKAGTYRTEHTVSVVCDQPDWCDTPVVDFLRVEQRASSLHVSIELVQANAHTCSFRGDLKPLSATHWAFRNADGEEPCLLELKASGDSISLTSEGCRYHCGARASLFGEFSAAPDDPDPTAFDCAARCKAVDVCAQELQRPSANCQSACYKLERPARDQFDDCVREAVDDCATVFACR